MAARKKKPIDKTSILGLAQSLSVLGKHLESCAKRMTELELESVEAEISTAQNQALETITMAISRIETAINAKSLQQKMSGHNNVEHESN